MKKRRFYKNKNRNTKWTEPETGRPLSFAGKYDKGDYADREAETNAPTTSAMSDIARARAKREKRRIRLFIIAVCLCLVCIGYIGADVFMLRHAEPLAAFDARQEEQAQSGIESADIPFTAARQDGLCLDGAVMLSSVIDEAQKAGYTAVAFDAKRSAGTIGYASSLAAVETFAAVSEAGTKPAQSVQQLTDNDLLPVACVCCYQDNVVPLRAADMAVSAGDALYTDSSGNTYLNPDNPSAYKYIKDIIQELNGCGVNVFVLSGCSLPQEIAEGYGDGFLPLAAKLNRDISGIKLLEAVEVTVSGVDAESGEVNSAGIEKDIAAFPQLGENQIYRITTPLAAQDIRTALENAGIYSYIITD